MKLFWIFLFLVLSQVIQAKEYHVSISGSDGNRGTAVSPFRTIGYAAGLARAGDVITVHEGVYRELVSPSHGGVSGSKRIVYQAAKGEEVQIKGSEIIRGWKMVRKGVWRVAIPDAFFGSYNPYKVEIQGDWFFPPKGRKLHTGEIYLNGKALHEAESVNQVVVGAGTWFSLAENRKTVLYANFSNYDTSKDVVEISVRPTCFYPVKTGVNYITVKGFQLLQAATQWAAPTAEQVGIIGTNWSKGWIIEDNVISDSKCVGITLGKDRSSGHNVWFQNPALDGSVLYNQVIERVIAGGWNKDNIGSHIVRNNTIYNCGQAVICGSFGAAFSQITGNHIYNIYTFRPFWGAEMGGIKIHGAIDVVISGNRVHNTNIGIWLDWMAQGTRVSGNLVYGNDYVDFFPEVSHGPYLVDNNLFLSPFAIKDWSEGGRYAHNLITGLVSRAAQERATPYFLPHSTVLVVVKSIHGGDNRFYNNIFVGNGDKPYLKPVQTWLPPDAIDVHSGYGLGMYDDTQLPVLADGNVYLNGAVNLHKELNLRIATDFDPRMQLVSDDEGMFLTFRLGSVSGGYKNKLVTTTLLGKAVVPNMPFENPDGNALKVDKDYLGNRRNEENPMVGPFENIRSGNLKVKVW